MWPPAGLPSDDEVESSLESSEAEVPVAPAAAAEVRVVAATRRDSEALEVAVRTAVESE